MLKEQERLLSEIEELANETIPKKTKITITYVNGENESFDLNYDTRAKTIMDLKQRKQYYYIKDTIINMNNVIKIKFEDME